MASVEIAVRAVFPDGFDWAFYVSHYEDLKHFQNEKEARRHYRNHGRHEGRLRNHGEFINQRKRDLVSGAAEFDIAAYKFYNDDLLHHFSTDEEFVEHFIRHGAAEGRRARFVAEEVQSNQVRARMPNTTFAEFGVIRHMPVISVIVVSFNSGRDLDTLFASLAAQTYRPLEIVLVENGSEDSDAICRRYFSEFVYLKPGNVGFAEGNNLGVNASSGELLALINPDTRLEHDCLQQLIDAIRFDSHAAIAVPKINFFERFVGVAIKAEGRFEIPRADLLDGLTYRKLFVREGRDLGDTLVSNDDGLLMLDVPWERQKRAVTLQARAGREVSYWQTSVGYTERTERLTRPQKNFSIHLTFDEQSCASARYIINNAGSAVDSDGWPYDRAFGQFDDGEYYSKAYVPALCGCAALIRRIAVLDRDLFVAPFFAYYEDSELSYHIGKQGYRILYQPEAHIYHRHSESTDEGSPLWNMLVRRSRTLYEIMVGRGQSRREDFFVDYASDVSPTLMRTLVGFDRRIRESGSVESLFARRRKTACVYNSYFSSMGGGEKHALDVAAALTADYDVYLASESDFDVTTLSAYFGIDLLNVRKIISTVIDTHFTTKFDLFVNSTYCSNLVSAAPASAYIVSFPHLNVDPLVLKQYTFLHNSQFTQGWAEQYWGSHDAAVVLPICGYGHRSELTQPTVRKERLLLSVGRFTFNGHCKNHHKIIAAFRTLVDSDPGLGDWKLVIAGSCDSSNPDGAEYLRELLRLAEGYNVIVAPNETREALEALYARAAIYVHATGLGTPPDRPELHEHFGITCYEAMRSGCVPLVYAIGGPADQTTGLDQRRLFSDDASLRDQMRELMLAWDSGEIEPGSITAHADVILSANADTLSGVIDALNQPREDFTQNKAK